MNIGNDTAYYLDRGFKVIAIEADPILCKNARNRFKYYIDNKQLNIINIGVAPKSGTMTFWVCEKKSVYNSFNKELSSRINYPLYPIEVEVKTFDSILAEYGIPYYLKIDIEGYDKYCLDGLSSENLPEYISLEDNGSVEDIKRLKNLGYSKFKLISQYNFLPIEINPIPETIEFERKFKKLISNRFIGEYMLRLVRSKLFANINPVSKKLKYCFPQGSSGTFGENTLGNWLSFEETIDTYNHFKQKFISKSSSIFWQKEEYSFWFDIHAKVN